LTDVLLSKKLCLKERWELGYLKVLAVFWFILC